MDTIQKECNHHGLTTFVARKNGDKIRYRCRQCAVDAVDKRRKAIKLRAIEYLGGKCLECGYSKCPAALEFHHRDPTQKDFGIGSGSALGWGKIQTELDKCDLLCANCHREEHAK